MKTRVKGYVNIYHPAEGICHGDLIFPTKEYADMHMGRDRIACALMTGEYEVPDPEEKIEITKSQFLETWNRYRQTLMSVPEVLKELGFKS